MSEPIDLRKLAEPFPAADIEWRVGQSGQDATGKLWAKVLAYIQSRAVMDRLDAVCGPENWKVSYREVAPSSMGDGETEFSAVICSLSIRIAGEWVTKEDGAEKTDIESFKGGLSSALKRAAVPWGIGRYLYNLEAGWADISNDRKPGYEWAKTKDGKSFYWKAPLLPDWALPKTALKAPAPTAIVNHDKQTGKTWGSDVPSTIHGAGEGFDPSKAIQAALKNSSFKETWVGEAQNYVSAKYAKPIGSLTPQEASMVQAVIMGAPSKTAFSEIQAVRK